MFDDLWRFDLASSSWAKMPAAPSDGLPPQPWGLAPPGRSHASLVAAPPSTLLLYGGARCTPGCRCYGEAWVYELQEEARKGSWLRVNVSGAAPVHRYRQALVRDASDGSFYLFGGESYRPYMYHNALERLQIESLSGSTRRAAEPVAGATSTPAGSAKSMAAMLPAAAAGVGVGLLAFWLIRKLFCAPREPIR